MKLLVISDFHGLLEEFEKISSGYQFQSVDIDFLYIGNEALAIDKIASHLASHRYHLCLGVFGAVYTASHSTIINSVNHYASQNIVSLLSKNQVSQHPNFQKFVSLPSIVNRTTSYFNVFLEIEKGVSYTKEPKEELKVLPRLDSYNTINYIVALLCACSNYPNYCINYNQDLVFDVSSITSIIKLLD